MVDPGWNLLLSKDQIQHAVVLVANKIIKAEIQIDAVCPVLTGGLMFAADLTRALYPQYNPLILPIRYRRNPFVADYPDGLRGRNILLVDGCLDSGHTVMQITASLMFRGAKSIRAAVLVDKGVSILAKPFAQAVFTGYQAKNLTQFIQGYGMDGDCGRYRGMNEVWIRDTEPSPKRSDVPEYLHAEVRQV